MKQIPLTQGKFALVDDEDYDRVNKLKWHTVKRKRNYYAFASKRLKNPKRFMTYSMHRFILGITDSKMLTDHIDHNGLNNQKSNLRICTPLQSNHNLRSHLGAASKYVGVTHRNRKKQWRASLRTDNKYISLGSFYTEEEAAIARDLAAIKYKGEFAHLNLLNHDGTRKTT